jgi:tetratricopeptide (TPR) repeat protein
MDEELINRAMESGDQNLAEKAFREIDIHLNSSTDVNLRAGLLLRKAVLYGVLRRFDDSREQLDLALEQSPSEPAFHLNFDFIRGSLYDQEGLPEKALAYLTAVLSTHAQQLSSPEFRSTYEDIQQRRALDSVRVGKFHDAVPLLKECLSFELKRDERSNMLCNLGDCYSQLRNYEDARDCFLEAAKIGLPKEWALQAHCQLGIAYARLNFLRESKRELHLCEEQGPDHSFPMETVYGWLSWVCSRLGEKSESERYARLAHPI